MSICGCAGRVQRPLIAGLMMVDVLGHKTELLLWNTALKLIKNALHRTIWETVYKQDWLIKMYREVSGVKGKDFLNSPSACQFSPNTVHS